MYSLKSSFATFMLWNDIPEAKAAQVTGHRKGTTLLYGRYAKGHHLKELYKIVNKIDLKKLHQRELINNKIDKDECSEELEVVLLKS